MKIDELLDEAATMLTRTGDVAAFEFAHKLRTIAYDLRTPTGNNTLHDLLVRLLILPIEVSKRTTVYLTTLDDIHSDDRWQGSVRADLAPSEPCIELLAGPITRPEFEWPEKRT